MTKLLTPVTGAYLLEPAPQHLHNEALEVKVRSFREQTLDDLHQKVTAHESHLSKLDEDLFKRNKPKVDEEHHNLYKEFVGFAEEIKELKKEIFTLVEMQMKRSKQASMEVENGDSIF
jgi:hypothetical protein